MGVDAMIFVKRDGITDQQIDELNDAAGEQRYDIQSDPDCAGWIVYNTFSRYFSADYPRGNWPQIRARIETMRAAFPDRPVHYGGDSLWYDEISACTDTVLARIDTEWERWQATGLDYSGFLDTYASHPTGPNLQRAAAYRASLRGEPVIVEHDITERYDRSEQKRITLPNSGGTLIISRLSDLNHRTFAVRAEHQQSNGVVLVPLVVEEISEARWTDMEMLAIDALAFLFRSTASAIATCVGDRSERPEVP